MIYAADAKLHLRKVRAFTAGMAALSAMGVISGIDDHHAVVFAILVANVLVWFIMALECTAELRKMGLQDKE